MTRMTSRLLTLVVPMVLALLMGLAGCGEDHRNYGDRDRGQDTRQGSDRDQHEDRHEGDRH